MFFCTNKKGNITHSACKLILNDYSLSCSILASLCQTKALLNVFNSACSRKGWWRSIAILPANVLQDETCYLGYFVKNYLSLMVRCCTLAIQWSSLGRLSIISSHVQAGGIIVNGQELIHPHRFTNTEQFLRSSSDYLFDVFQDIFIICTVRACLFLLLYKLKL